MPVPPTNSPINGLPCRIRSIPWIITAAAEGTDIGKEESATIMQAVQLATASSVLLNTELGGPPAYSKLASDDIRTGVIFCSRRKVTTGRKHGGRGEYSDQPGGTGGGEPLRLKNVKNHPEMFSPSQTGDCTADPWAAEITHSN
jgi:hypothetical protein